MEKNNMQDTTVLILLAAYNGEAYIRQMIDSVLEQDYRNIHLVLSDDHSGDHTPSILDEYANAYPEKVEHYHSGLRFGCAQKHFLHLLNRFHDAPYIMFCDQDDVWHSDKVRKTLEKMKQVEGDKNQPAMVHTDLRVVDQTLRETAPSFCKFSGLDGSRLQMNQLLVQNVVTGCTMMINHALALLACREVPQEVVLMHDWWLALLASATGSTGFLNEATIDYRQHGKNSVGAKNIRSASYLWERLRSKSMRQGINRAAYQAEAFLKCYEDILRDDTKQLLAAFAQTQRQGLLRRNMTYLEYGLLKNGFVRVAAQLLGL